MEEPYEHPMKGQLEKIIEGYGEIKKTDMSDYISQLDRIEEIVPSINTEAVQKWQQTVQEDPKTKALKEKLGIK
jgi:FMN-dependent NADH-azoreductase